SRGREQRRLGCPKWHVYRHRVTELPDPTPAEARALILGPVASGQAGVSPFRSSPIKCPSAWSPSSSPSAAEAGWISAANAACGLRVEVRMTEENAPGRRGAARAAASHPQPRDRPIGQRRRIAFKRLCVAGRRTPSAAAPTESEPLLDELLQVTRVGSDE